MAQLQPWIDDLYAEGSTNTLDALRFALADPNTEAIYLLTDGRPDQVKFLFWKIKYLSWDSWCLEWTTYSFTSWISRESPNTYNSF